MYKYAVNIMSVPEIIERSQEDKSTVKYRTFVLLKELQLIWVQLQLIWVRFFECALGHVDHIYIYIDICDVDFHVQI